MKNKIFFSVVASLALASSASAYEITFSNNPAIVETSLVFGNAAGSPASLMLTFLDDGFFAENTSVEKIFSALTELGDKLFSPQETLDDAFFEGSNFYQGFSTPSVTNFFAPTDTLYLAVGDAVIFSNSANFTLLKFTESAATGVYYTWDNVCNSSELVEFYLTSPNTPGIDWQVLTANEIFGEIASNGVLALVAVPEPALFGVLVGCLALTLAGTRRHRENG